MNNESGAAEPGGTGQFLERSLPRKKTAHEIN